MASRMLAHFNCKIRLISPNTTVDYSIARKQASKAGRLVAILLYACSAFSPHNHYCVLIWRAHTHTHTHSCRPHVEACLYNRGPPGAWSLGKQGAAGFLDGTFTFCGGPNTTTVSVLWHTLVWCVRHFR